MKLKKRLPALLLALFLAFSPLMLAVSAQASVLDGDVYGSASFGTAQGYFPLPYSNGVFAIELVSGSPVAVTYCFSPNPISVTVEAAFGAHILFSGEDLHFLTVPFSDSGVDIYFFNGSSSVPDAFVCSPYLFFFGDVSFDLIEGFVSVPLEVTSVSSPDVFSVFSGVGSWFGGAVNNLIPMFYTAESGLTVLGVLAVASLALALILLFLYLIAGWLKFR